MSEEDHLQEWKAEHPDWAKDLMPRLRDEAPLHVKDLFPEEALGSPVKPDPGEPKMWDAEPNGVTHIAAPAMHVFGIFLRQRCAWCGFILVDYDLRNVAVPVDQPGLPATWEVMGLVRVDGHISAAIEGTAEEDGNVQLPPDACCFNPKARIGYIDPETPVTYNERTLFKVRDGLMESGLDDKTAIAAITGMQNRGILFRERA